MAAAAESLKNVKEFRMKKIVLACSAFILTVSFLGGCSSLKLKRFEAIVRPTMTVDDAVEGKLRIDGANNPALKYTLNKELSDKIMYVNDVLVKDIIPSTDIDYTFCVVAQLQHPKGLVEFYIYSKDTATIAKLDKGKTTISAIGDFRRFVNLLGDSFVMMDVVDADITVRN